MTRPSKQTIAALLDEFANLQARRIGLKLKLDRELQPIKEKFDRDAAPLLAEANKRFSAIDGQLGALKQTIEAQLMSGVDQQAETVALSHVSVDLETTKQVAAAVLALNKAGADALRTSEANKPLIKAVASVDETPGNREIGAETLFNYVPVAERTGSFWSMFTVLIKKAEEVLGKEKVDALATKPKRYSVSISLKP